jgi:ribosomal-protein-alanine N-acetyltransferase
MAHRPTWYLRRTAAADAERLYALLCLPEVYRYLTDGAAPSRARVEQWIARTQPEVVVDGMGLWLLEDQERHLAGGVSLEQYRQPRSAELIYLLHPQFWGQGLATRMSWTVMQQAFAAGHVEQIVAGADLPNTASVAVMRRLGMQWRRAVQYPLGPGVEYVARHDDPAPKWVPMTIPFIA